MNNQNDVVDVMVQSGAIRMEMHLSYSARAFGEQSFSSSMQLTSLSPFVVIEMKKKIVGEASCVQIWAQLKMFYDQIISARGKECWNVRNEGETRGERCREGRAKKVQV